MTVDNPLNGDPWEIEADPTPGRHIGKALRAASGAKTLATLLERDEYEAEDYHTSDKPDEKTPPLNYPSRAGLHDALATCIEVALHHLDKLLVQAMERKAEQEAAARRDAQSA